MWITRLTLPFCLLALSSLVMSADLEREKRIANQIKDAIFDGEPLFLNSNGHEFLSIHMRSDAEPLHGTVLLLHGTGANPDWTDVIHPLRVGLTESGWDTLSIQLPVTEPGATAEEWRALTPDALARIDAALQFLQQQETAQVIIVAHSSGGRIATRYLASKPSKQVEGLVVVGLGIPNPDPESGVLGDLSQLQLPVFDLYGERDLVDVLNTVDARKAAFAHSGNDDFQQFKVAGADHFFAGMDEALLEQVSAWLNQHTANMP